MIPVENMLDSSCIPSVIFRGRWVDCVQNAVLQLQQDGVCYLAAWHFQCSFSSFPFGRLLLPWDHWTNSPAIPKCSSICIAFHYLLWMTADSNSNRWKWKNWEEYTVLKCPACNFNLKYDFLWDTIFYFKSYFLQFHSEWLFYFFQIMNLSLSILSEESQSALWPDIATLWK